MTPLVLRNCLTVDALIPKLTFSGNEPMDLANLNLFNWETTTPTIFPYRSYIGPPLLPGWTGACIWNWVESSPIPFVEFTFPKVIYDDLQWNTLETSGQSFSQSSGDYDIAWHNIVKYMAEREGFEPSRGFHPYTLSRRAP